ncbi:MFS transporter [Planctomycetota bacterium]
MNKHLGGSKQRQWAFIPFNPQRWPFFYGWVIVAAATVGIIASVPGQTIGVGVFTDALVAALTLSRTQLTVAYMLGTIGSSFLLPLAGTLTDRWGTRAMITGSALGLGGSLLVMMQLHRLPRVIHSVYGLVGAAAVVFLLIRFFGQGCLTMVSRIAIGKWFDRRRGLATGISNIMVSYFFNVSPFLLNAWVDSVGWRLTYLRLAGIAGLGMAVVGWVFFRNSPEACGLRMDGDNQGGAGVVKRKRIPAIAHQFTRGEALRTPAFWAYTLSTAWQALFMTAVGFHLTGMGQEQGLSREACYAVFPVIGIVSAVSALVGGWLSDRIRLRWLLQTTVLCQMLSALGLFGLSGSVGRLVFIVGYGVSVALFGLLLTTVWPRYYGRKHLGAISGLAMSTLVFASAIGPFLFSAIRDTSASYQPVFLAAAGIPLGLFALTIFARNPQRLRSM